MHIARKAQGELFMTSCKLCNEKRIEKIFDPKLNRYTNEYKCENCGAIYTLQAFQSIEDYPATIQFWTGRR